ncbi:hypothetical protein [Pseudomonas sp. SO81]|jgi:hypothetical protein|uniref:hypothetical protein n=1 Tax=Pseudomonas sp. SO81 TaxID=2983246 RepID=UPI0025A465DB|nr:hypothetical protein [Pseudomonas sp. SO81]WJN58209.1 hypothetical protein OH686_05650 [Pseudomonas sp. SO81]
MNDPVNDHLRAALDAQVEAFLTTGGEITQVAIGTTGIPLDHKKAHWSSRAGAKKPPTKG